MNPIEESVDNRDRRSQRLSSASLEGASHGKSHRYKEINFASISVVLEEVLSNRITFAVDILIAELLDPEQRTQLSCFQTLDHEIIDVHMIQSANFLEIYIRPQQKTNTHKIFFSLCSRQDCAPMMKETKERWHSS